MVSQNPLRKSYGQLTEAGNAQQALQAWQQCQKVLADPCLSDHDRQIAYLSLRQDLRDRIIYHADVLASSYPGLYPPRAITLQNYLSELQGIQADSFPRPGDYALTLPHQSLIESLCSCETDEQLDETVMSIILLVDDLPIEARDACLRLTVRTIEDTLIRLFQDHLTEETPFQWIDVYLSSLYTALQQPLYGNYALAFAKFDGERFLPVNADTICGCTDLHQLQGFLTILRKGLALMPEDRVDALLETLSEELYDGLLARLAAENSMTPLLLALIRFVLVLCDHRSWLKDATIFNWIMS